MAKYSVFVNGEHYADTNDWEVAQGISSRMCCIQVDEDYYEFADVVIVDNETGVSC